MINLWTIGVTNPEVIRCYDMIRKCNNHLQTYIRRSINLDNDKLREYAKRAVIRKARHIVKLTELIRYYQNGGNQ